MSRLARIKSKSEIYHVIVRGINRQNIFQDDKDRYVYLNRLAHYKNECGIKLFAYCLMPNHVHLLVQEKDKPLNEFMKKLGISYSFRYNIKHDRVGHLFQDRYRSEPVEEDLYLLTVFKYIHQNPCKAGLDDFIWTSYRNYTGQESGIIDTEFILSLFKSKKSLMQFLNKEIDEKCMDVFEKRRVNNDEAIKKIMTAAKIKDCKQLQTFEIKKRNEILNELKEAGLPIRQIEKLTGINRGIILRA